MLRRPFLPFLSFLCGLAIPLSVAAAEPAEDREGIEFFEKKIRPVLVAKCYECHSSGAKKIEGKFLLETRAGLLAGGEQGGAVVPGKPDESLLIQAIRHTDDAFKMPPKEKLPPEVIADFEAWVKRGAPDPRIGPAAPSKYKVDIEAAKQRWPFTPLAEPPLPKIKDETWPVNGLDRFILAKLEERGLVPSPPAEKRALLRRVCFDLIGLPPTPEEIASFLADDSPEAFARVVDRLLETPAYGERWGRHWLDVVRYADTAGDNSDFPIPQAYRYRNYVIDALNADMPFDQFIREQIAGDLLPARDFAEKQRQIIATGYLAQARRFGSTVDDYPQHLTIEDTIDNLGRAFLGLTVNCARCHDHKFDPIAAQDYYALYGIFHSTRYPWPGIELEKKPRDFVPLATDEQIEQAKQDREARKKEIGEKLKPAEAARKEAEGKLNEANQRVETAKKEKKPDDEVKKLGEEQAAAKKAFDEADKALNKFRGEKGELETGWLPFEHAYAVAEGKKIESCKVHLKGDPARLGAEAPRGFLKVLGGQRLSADDKTSGRKQLADWISGPDNPLTARVLANRLWHYHFGRGLVATPNDFGKQGRAATHPELLDWLARRLIESGWSLKAMHRLILASRTYQQSSEANPTAAELDPPNDLWGRYPRRRLDAETLRDTLLLLGGRLDRTPGGPHPFPAANSWGYTQHNPFRDVYETNRRTVYLMTQRIQRHPYLAVFDGPDTGASTGSRLASTTTLQALYLLNDPLVHSQAASFAARIRQQGPDDAARLTWTYLSLLGRPPREEEAKSSLAYLAAVQERLGGKSPSEEHAKQAWESLVRVLFRMNEFVYID